METTRTVHVVVVVELRRRSGLRPSAAKPIVRAAFARRELVVFFIVRSRVRRGQRSRLLRLFRDAMAARTRRPRGEV